MRVDITPKAPVNAKYIVQQADGTLTNEQSLGALSTGIMKVTTTTGAVTSLGDPLPVANGGTGVTSLGANVVTFLQTPSSANLIAAVTDETGSGLLVFGTSPTIATPTLSLANTSPTAAGGIGYDQTNNELQLGDGSSSQVVRMGVWIDYSSTATVTGWAATPTKNIRYAIIGKLIHVIFRVTGTSNATTASFSLPVACVTGHPQIEMPILVVDNTVQASTPGIGEITSGSTSINFYKDWTGTAWTNSGTKTIAGEFFYESA